MVPLMRCFVAVAAVCLFAGIAAAPARATSIVPMTIDDIARAADVLVELAGAVGLDSARAQAIAGGQEFATEVRERERHWREQGVSAVPTVVVDGRHAIEGAQPPEAFEQALRQAAREG